MLKHIEHNVDLETVKINESLERMNIVFDFKNTKQTDQNKFSDLHNMFPLKNIVHDYSTLKIGWEIIVKEYRIYHFI